MTEEKPKEEVKLTPEATKKQEPEPDDQAKEEVKPKPEAEKKPQVKPEPKPQAQAKPQLVEKPSNCGACGKPIKKLKRYYRNNKFYCNKKCWRKATKQKEEKK